MRSSLKTTVSGSNPGAPPPPRVPATTTCPPGRVSETASAKALGTLAVTSTTTWASLPMVSWRATTGSCWLMSIVRSTPNRRASVSRRWSRGPSPVIATQSAPASFTAMDAHKPRIPGPRIATMSPGAVRGSVDAHLIPAPKGLNSVAVTGSRPSGIGSSRESGGR